MIRTQQCAADHIREVKGERRYYYCVLNELHKGQHVDCNGKTWSVMWPDLETRQRPRKTQP